MIFDVSVIIVNYKTSLLVEKCIVSVKEFCKGVNLEIIVVDNNSNDEGFSNLINIYHDVIFLKKDINNGFGSGNNFASTFAKGEYLFFLNPDTYFIDNSIQILYDFIKSNKNAGIVSPTLKNPDLTIQYSYNRFHTFVYFILEAFYLHPIIIKKVKKKQATKNNGPFEIDWPIGAAFLIKNNLFKEIGGFDENYFMYYEDADIALRIKKRGYRNYCVPLATVVHILSSSTGDKKFSKFHVHRSRLIYLLKNFKYIDIMLLRVIFIFSILLRMITSIFYKQKYFTNRKENLFYHLKNIKLYFYGKDRILSASHN